jgi:DNA-binding response OmpR family regulator
MDCPCCGQVIPDDGNRASVSLETNTVTFRGLATRLEPLQAEILSVIAEQAPRYITVDALMRRVFGILEQDGSIKGLHVAVSRMRKKIEPMGLRLINARSRGAACGGYSLMVK